MCAMCLKCRLYPLKDCDNELEKLIRKSHLSRKYFITDSDTELESLQRDVLGFLPLSPLFPQTFP